MSSGMFNENSRVQVPACLHLWRLGYEYLDGDDIARLKPDSATNILTEVFIKSVLKLNPKMSEKEAYDVLTELVQVSNNDDLGRQFYYKIVATSGVKIIDFRNPNNNCWQCTTEFTCENTTTHDNFRPDITCFVNGLPLAFIEVKKPNNHDGMIAERDRINQRFRNQAFRSFLNVTQLMLFSNNQEYETENVVPVQGAFYATIAKKETFFNVFREENGCILTEAKYNNVLDDDVQKKILIHRNCIPIKEDAEYQTNLKPTTPTNRIITSMLSRRRFLSILQYAFTYVEKQVKNASGEMIQKLEKHVMRYQQLFATLALQQRLSENRGGG